MLGLVRMPLLMQEQRVQLAAKPAGRLGSVIAGVAFGAGWTPCIGPVLATILLYAGMSATVLHGAALLAAYALGLGIPFFVAAVAFNWFLSRTRCLRRWLVPIERAAGAVMVVAGALLFTGRFVGPREVPRPMNVRTRCPGSPRRCCSRPPSCFRPASAVAAAHRAAPGEAPDAVRSRRPAARSSRRWRPARRGTTADRRGRAVTVLEFADFGCRYCARFAAETYPALADEFVKTGQVRWRYVPFVLGMFPNGDEAARAGGLRRRRRARGAFGRMHDRLFADQDAWTGAGDPAGAFRRSPAPRDWTSRASRPATRARPRPARSARPTRWRSGWRCARRRRSSSTASASKARCPPSSSEPSCWMRWGRVTATEREVPVLKTAAVQERGRVGTWLRIVLGIVLLGLTFVGPKTAWGLLGLVPW